MADDCRPWLAKAIIKHDQKHGANFGAIATGELCQLVQFYNFRGKFDPHAQIFGEICDKMHWVRVRFDVNATNEFEATAHGVKGSNLTSHLREMFRILEYRIIPADPSDRLKAPWYKPKTKESLSRTTSGTGYDSATSSAAGSSKTQLPMIILEILKWEIPCGNRDDPLYWRDQIKELGFGPKDGEVQKVLIKWWTGDSDKSQEVPVEDEEEAPVAGPSRSNAKPKPKDKGEAKAIAPPPAPVAPVTYPRATIIDDLIAGRRTTLPDWLFDVSDDQREELDNIQFFGLDAMKDINLSLGEPAPGQAEASAEVQGAGEGEAEEGAGSLPTPRQSVSPAPAVKAEPEADTRSKIGPFRVRQSNARVTVSPIPSSPPPGQAAAAAPTPAPIAAPPPAPASPAPSESANSDEEDDDALKNTLSLPTPGQRFRPTKSSGPTPSQPHLRSSIPEPTPGQGSPEPRGSNPASIRFTNTQNPLTLPPANQRQRRGQLQDGTAGSSQSSSAGQRGSQEQSIRSVVIDPKFDKSGLAMKTEASSSIPSPTASKVVVGNHKMRKSRPSIEDFLVPELRIKKKKKNYLASSPASSGDEGVDMGNGGGEEEEENEGDESDGKEEESEDGLSEYEARQRKNRPSTSRGKTAKTPPSSASQQDLESSPPPIPAPVPKHTMRSVSRGKGKGKARVSGSSQSQPSQPSQPSRPSQPSQSHSQSSQKHSQSQTQTQTPQISSAEEAQRITPGQFLRPAYPSITGRLKSPTKSLSASQESVDMLAAYRPASNEEEEEVQPDQPDVDGEEEERDESEEEEDEEEEEETLDTPPRDLSRAIVKNTGGAQLVVESVESGTASSGRGKGRVLVDDSEESAEKAQAQGSSGVQSTFEAGEVVDITVETSASALKTGKKRARDAEEKEEDRGDEKRAKMSATKVKEREGGTQANDPQPRLSVFGQINRMIRRLTGSSQERGEEPAANGRAEVEADGEEEGDVNMERDQAPAQTLVASARSAIPPSATAGATLHSRHSSTSSSKVAVPGPVVERKATTSISQSSRTIPTQHSRHSSSSSRSAIPPTVPDGTAKSPIPVSAGGSMPKARKSTAIPARTPAAPPAPAPRTSTSFLVPDLLIPSPASSLSSTRKQSSTKTGRRESVKRESAEDQARQAPASATGTSTGPSKAAASGRRPPAPPRTFSIGPDGLPAPSRPVSRETPVAAAVKQEQRGSSVATATGGGEVKREREAVARDEKPAVVQPKVERPVQKLRGFRPDLRVHDGLEEDWVVEKISEARLKRLALKQEAGA